jgi:hypothetical protein
MRNSDPAERARLQAADDDTAPWREWGPYLSERAWGTVREDYSDYGDSWAYFPHDHARSRAYRWNEDGLGGICDDQQRFCFAFAFWNGTDTILKERVFGLTGPEGNHGEDGKEYWWYLDSTPTHSYMRWGYHYPQVAYPYNQLRDANRDAGRENPEVELLDTGVFAEDRYWGITVEYAKNTPHDMAILLTVTNHGPDEATLDVLPTLWFRNTWAWTVPVGEQPQITATDGQLLARHAELGQLVLAGDRDPVGVACDNETNAERLWSQPGRSEYPKDGINDHVVRGADTVNPDRTGTKAALHYKLTVAAGATAEIRLRLASALSPNLDLGADHTRVLSERASEADDYFVDLTPSSTSADAALVLRQAVAGLMWSKQFYHYDVALWLSGDPSTSPPSPGRLYGRNARWSHMRCHDVISMPDAWEYPWFAAWDLAFHCVAIANVDPGFAKAQLSLLLDERYQHPDGQVPAYEWAFDDVNPPAQAWAALQVFHREGGWDFDFLARVLPGLVRNFEWWTRAKEIGERHVFGGGFLGLDNVGPIERTTLPPGAGTLVQADGTAWMAMYAAHLAEIAAILSARDPGQLLTAQTYLAKFDEIVGDAYAESLWHEEAGFFFDVLHQPDGSVLPVPARSVVGLLPMCAVRPVVPGALTLSPTDAPPALVDPDKLRRILARMLDEAEFLSPYGLRSLSKAHQAEPATITLDGVQYTADYEPGESRTSTFGGNSNWRGPVWFPVNLLLVNALRDHHRRLGESFRVPYPAGSDDLRHLDDVADELSARLVRLFLNDAAGKRPIFGESAEFQTHPDWHDSVLFYEYFHGDNGAGLGAAHQTGWTALVIDLIRGPHGH